MRVGTVIASLVCIGALGGSAFFGMSAYDEYNRMQVADKSLTSLKQSIDMCKSSMPEQESTVSYYDVYTEITNIAGLKITKIFTGTEENEITDVQELYNLEHGTELHIKCSSIYQTAIIDIIRMPHIKSVIETKKGMEVIIKL